MQNELIKTEVGEFRISEQFTDGIGLNGSIPVGGKECVLAALIVRGRRKKLRIRRLDLIPRQIDWSKVKPDASRWDVYLNPPPSLRRQLVSTILSAVESFLVLHPSFFEDAGDRWLFDDVRYIEEQLADITCGLAEAREGLERMKAFIRAPRRSRVYSADAW